VRTLLTIAGLALLAAGSAPVAHASVAPTCQGKPATIVDLDGPIKGTRGDDVIVGGDHAHVRAKSGDDTICIVSGKVYGGEGRDSVEAIGTETSDYVKLIDVEVVDLHLHEGADRVWLRIREPTGGRGVIDGGDGGEEVLEDHLFVIATRSLDVDLEDSVLIADELARYRLLGFSQVLGAAPRVRLAGDSADNSLAGNACHLRVYGGRGRDDLGVAKNYRRDGRPCPHPSQRLYGQRGNDVVRGGNYDDLLVGGPGRDRANGWDGIDRCLAERVFFCER
jgi:Ca2+-binding RTX toxin-like protein